MKYYSVVGYCGRCTERRQRRYALRCICGKLIISFSDFGDLNADGRTVGSIMGRNADGRPYISPRSCFRPGSAPPDARVRARARSLVDHHRADDDIIIIIILTTNERGDAVDKVGAEVEDLAPVESEYATAVRIVVYPAHTSARMVGLPLSPSPRHVLGEKEDFWNSFLHSSIVTSYFRSFLEVNYYTRAVTGSWETTFSL